MTIKIYRGYPDNEPYTGDNVVLSIVATDSDFIYISSPDSGFDDERKEMLIETLKYNKQELPKDAEGWVALAMYNISGLSYKNVTGDEEISDDLYDEVIMDEIVAFEDAKEARDSQEEAMTAAAASCPPATQDIALNLKNRKNAIDTAMYGPLNPEEPNEEYWQGLANEWKVDVETAKRQRCGNCAVFVVTTDMKNCIAQGIEQGGSSESDAWDAIGTAELGYCEAFDFKCAASRTCRAWVTGGPIDDSKAKEQ